MTVKELIYNKKVVFYGDSITHNWEKYDHDYNLTHPEDENYPYGLGYGHVKMLNDVCNFKSVDNFAVSGGCYANCPDINPARKEFRNFPSQVIRASEKIKEAEGLLEKYASDIRNAETELSNITTLDRNLKLINVLKDKAMIETKLPDLYNKQRDLIDSVNRLYQEIKALEEKVKEYNEILDKIEELESEINNM